MPAPAYTLPAAESNALSVAAAYRVRARRAANALKPEEIRERYVNDPVGWVKDRLGEHLWSKQREIADAVVSHRRVAVPSAHETGKSFLASRLTAFWLDVHPPGEAFVVTTATTGSQVKAVLWREINRAHRKGHLAGHTNQTEWWIDGEMVAFGRKPSDYEPTAFQGIHARYVLLIIDEACGVPENLWTAGASLCANEHSRQVAIGNPDDPQSHFAKISAPDSGWKVIHVSAFDSPNFTDEPIPEQLRGLLISPIYAAEVLADGGGDEANPIYVSKVGGRFPEDTTDGVILLSWIRACQALELKQGLPIELGVDIGAGGDETSIRARRGPVALKKRWHKKTPDWSDAVALVIEAIDEVQPTSVKIDVIGIGWGVCGRLIELKREGRIKCEIVPVNVGAASTQKLKFVKLRDQIWWEVGRGLSSSKAWDLSGLDDKTVAQLIAPKWSPDSAGRIHVEPKDETRKRLGRSPDDADALLLCFYVPPPRRGKLVAPGGITGKSTWKR